MAQEFAPSDFDWRVGVLDGQPLYACRYHMAKGHWQIVQRPGREPRATARWRPSPWRRRPQRWWRWRSKAARHIGDGLYGVDLKEVDGRVVVMEVNDNPNLDAGYEDAILKDALWDEVIRLVPGRGWTAGAGAGRA